MVTPPSIVSLNVGPGFTTIVIAHVMFSISFVAAIVRARVVTLDRSIEDVDALEDLWVRVALPASSSLLAVLLACAPCIAADYPAPQQGDWIARDFRFHTGEVMPELKLHYTTVGAPTGQPVLLLHGTGSTSGFLDAPEARTLALQRQIQQAVLSGRGWEPLALPDAVRRQADTPWFQSLLAFDPTRVLRDVSQPLLVIHGGLDTQMPPEDAASLLAASRQRPRGGETHDAAADDNRSHGDFSYWFKVEIANGRYDLHFWARLGACKSARIER